MTPTELQGYRQELEAMIQRLKEEQTRLRHEVLGDEREHEVGTTQDQYSDDDLSREKSDENVAMTVLGTEMGLLEECEAALERIERGVFGRCIDCNHSISLRRLKAAPYVSRCIRCARHAEAGAT